MIGIKSAGANKEEGTHVVAKEASPLRVLLPRDWRLDWEHHGREFLEMLHAKCVVE